VSYHRGMRSWMLVLLVAIPAHADADDSLDRVAIADGVRKVHPKITACAATSKAVGTVKVKVDVAPAGTVTRVSVASTPDVALGDCVAAAIKTATFRATKQGGAFSYPFLFDGKIAEAPEPEALDRTAIAEGMNKLKPQIMACGDASKAKGRVKVMVEVAPSGAVAAATIRETPDQGLGTCISDVIKQGTFRRTAKGGSFSYPFIF